MRRLLSLTLVAAGCSGFSSQALEGDDKDRAPAEASCEIDGDCAAAASACCSCPTFATAIAGGDGCDPIQCPELVECAPTEPVCEAGACRLRCVEIEITSACEQGFAVDAAGCAIDACEPGGAVCQTDDDCARAPADCCGCELGGSDTAVPASSVDAHIEDLDCADDSFCPGIDACDEAATARCLGGTCRLVSGALLEDQLAVCGTPDAPSCQPGEVCVLNDPSAPPGVAICRQL